MTEKSARAILGPLGVDFVYLALLLVFTPLVAFISVVLFDSKYAAAFEIAYVTAFGVFPSLWMRKLVVLCNALDQPLRRATTVPFDVLISAYVPLLSAIALSNTASSNEWFGEAAGFVLFFGHGVCQWTAATALAKTLKGRDEFSVNVRLFWLLAALPLGVWFLWPRIQQARNKI